MADRINVKGTKPPSGEQAPRSSRAPAGGKGSSSGGGGSGATAAAARPALRGDDKKLHDALARMYSTIGGGIVTVGLLRDDVGLATAGVNVGAYANDTADAWIDLAQQNDAVRRMLNGFVQGSAVATLIGCHVAMAVPVLAARGAVPVEVASMLLHDDAKRAAADLAARRAAAAANGTTPA